MKAPYSKVSGNFSLVILLNLFLFKNIKKYKHLINNLIKINV